MPAEPQWDRVETEVALREALAGERWELALVDYNLPGFGGPQALALLAEAAPDVPAITVSGAIDEDTAVTTIKAGAVDYVLKDNLTRLAPAVQRAVDGGELRRAHRRAAESARLALYAVDNASLSIVNVAADGTVVYVNDFTCDQLEAAREDLVGAKVWDFDRHASADLWPEQWERMKLSRVTEFEVDRSGKDGRRRILDVTVNYLEGADCLISYGRDITERRRAEEALRQSEAMYRRIVELANEGVWGFDREHRVTFANEQMAQLLGYTSEDMVGRAYTDFVWPEDLADHEDRTEARVRGEPGRFESRYRTKDGREVWLAVNSVAELDDESGYAGAFTMCADVTERRRAEEALRAEQANLAAIFAASPVAMLVLDEHTTVVRVNPAALRLTRGGSESLLDYSPGDGVECGMALGCVHRADDPRGCGFSADCLLCPLRNGIESVLRGGVALHGVELSLEVEGSTRTAWLRWAPRRCRSAAPCTSWSRWTTSRSASTQSRRCRRARGTSAPSSSKPASAWPPQVRRKAGGRSTTPCAPCWGTPAKSFCASPGPS